jgi:hypothetical protein
MFPSGGDKFVDQSSDIAALQSRLCVPNSNPCVPQLNVLIVGSNVQQTALTSASFKYTISNWVYGGGTLIVLGSNLHTVEWLQPLKGGTLNNATGAIGSPDPTNPLLNTPEILPWQSYGAPAAAWLVNSPYYQPVIMSGAAGAGGLPSTLAISKPGAFGGGTVILTSYLPYNLLPGVLQNGVPEGTRFLHNLLSEAYSILYVDYGPSIPPGAEVAADTRLALVPHPYVKGAMLQIDVVFYTFH